MFGVKISASVKWQPTQEAGFSPSPIRAACALDSARVYSSPCGSFTEFNQGKDILRNGL